MLSQILKNDTETYALRVFRTLRLFRFLEEGLVTPETVGAYLANVGALLEYTPAHLALAKQGAHQLGRSDLALYFERKMQEERGHERWAAEDLAHLKGLFGVERAFEAAPPIARLAGNIERAIQQNPASYVGYIVFTEYFTVLIGPACLKALSGACGLPLSLFSVLDRHVELDREHAAEGFLDIDALLDDSRDGAAVLALVRAAMRHLEAFYDELADRPRAAGPTLLEATSAA